LNKRKRLLITPLALAAVFALGAAYAAKPGKAEQPYAPASAAKPGNGNGHWGEHFQGRGNVTNSRCQGMNRTANCITPQMRKDAARRAAAARAAAAGNTVAAPGKPGGGN